MSTYRLILKQAWKISWKNKNLWFFGFFASLISFGAELKIFSQVINQESGLKIINDFLMFLNTGIFSRNSLTNFIELAKSEPLSAIIFILFFLIIISLFLFFVWLATISQISIVNSVKQIIKNTKEKINIKNQIKKSNKKFWPVFWMNFINWIIVNAITISISLLLIISLLKEKSWIVFLYGILFIIFIPIILFISFIIKYAIAYIIIDGKTFSSALNKAWTLFKNNWIISTELAITLFFVNIIAIIIISILSLLFLSIFIGIAMASSVIIFSSQSLFIFLITIGIIITIAIITISSAILNTFQISAWTDLFIKLKENKAKSKLERIFEENKK